MRLVGSSDSGTPVPVDIATFGSRIRPIMQVRNNPDCSFSSVLATQVYCKRLLIEATQRITRLGVQRGTVNFAHSGSVLPAIRFALYSCEANGRPLTRVSGTEMITLPDGGSYQAMVAALSSPVTPPKIGLHTVCWVGNAPFVTGLAGALSGTDYANPGSAGASNALVPDWSEPYDPTATFSTALFADQAAFLAFQFPTSFSSLGSATWSSAQGNTPANADWQGVFERSGS